MSKCLILEKDRLGNYTPKSIQKLQNAIRKAFRDAIENSDGGANAALLLKELKKGFQKIGDECHQQQLDQVVDLIEQVAKEPDFAGLDYFVNRKKLHIHDNLSIKLRDTIEETTQDSYTESGTSKEELSKIKSQFLDDFFGNKGRLKSQAKQQVTHKMLSTFIIDRENGRIITNIGEANRMARQYKQELFDTVMNYFKKANPDEYDLDSTTLFNGDVYTGVVQNAKLLTRYLDVLTPTELQTIHDTNPEKYEAAVAWFTLKNFDNFVELLLGDAIHIHPSHKGKLKDGDSYKYSEKGSQVITTWRTDDNIILESEIGALAQSLINSTPFYKFGIDNKTGKYIKFEDFYRMITKMKDLAIDPMAKEIIFNDRDYASLFTDNSDLTKQEQDLIRNKSLRTIINNIRINPQVYTRLAMRLLTHQERNSKGEVKISVMRKLGYTAEEMDKTYSIYKGFFSNKDTESIFAIQDQYDHNVRNYYSLVTQVADSLFTVNFLQYNNDNGVITVRTLKDQSADNIRRRLETNIGGTNSRKIISSNFESLHMEPYKMEPLRDKDGNFYGIKYTIERAGGKNITAQYLINDNILTLFDESGKELKDSIKGNLLNDQRVLEFFDSQLHLDLANDVDFVEAIDVTYGNTINAVVDLFKLSSSIYANKYISNVELKDVKGRKAVISKLKNYYTKDDYDPGYNSNLGEMGLYSQKMLPTLDRIAAAKSITTGEAQSAQVRDADGNMLSSQTLSRLLGSLQTQWQNIIDNPNSAANGFSLLQSNLFKGCYTTKEFKSPFGNKPHTKFTVAESIQGNFLYDFVAGFMKVDNTSGKKIIGNGIVGLLPSVNSDKNTIGRMILDLSQSHKSGKKWSELSISELQQVIMEELGESYATAYENILKDFRKLVAWLHDVKSIDVIINPETNFKELNEYCEEQGISTADWLYKQTRDYNNTHSDNIRFIDQTHFITTGKTIKFNNTFRDLMKRYSDPTRLEEFFSLKRTEMIKSLLDENVQIDLFSDEDSGNTPKKWLRDQYKDWVHKGDIKNGKMVIAKLTYNGKTYNITTKADMVEFNQIVSATTGVKVNFLEHPHKLLNPKYGIKTELHPMLDKYNTLDYLFTQEFMIAGVGSHINHPGKAKYKTPVIWGHPGIGKTYALDNTGLGESVIDWDVEFNTRRDKWIKNVTGYQQGTPEFKAARTDYQVNWKNHEDFQNFVKNEWKRIKNLANSQNKILVASPHMLLEMFPNDFTKVLNMSAEDFIERGIARGDSYPQQWKEGIDKTLSKYIANPVNAAKVVNINKGEYLSNLAVNGSLYNEMAQLRENEMQEEAARFLAQHKRNVSYTAAMHEFQLNTINGIPSTYNMAIINDYRTPVYTISGDRGNHAPLDGATFVNPLVVIWENNSLEGDKAGIDKKQFVHYYDELTGTGGIIKTAGFGVTNDRVRCYKFYRDMAHNMMNRQWKNADGSKHIMRDGGILVDFNGKNVDYQDIYFEKDGKYYHRKINSYLGGNRYSITTTEVDIEGDTLTTIDDQGKTVINAITTELEVNSNYDVWNMFGGANSMELANGELKYSEISIHQTARAANNYGIVKEGINKVRSAEDVDQPMKRSDIHYMPTVGAIKQGACNINPASCFYGKHELNFMQVKMLQAGIQLDKEHHADNSELSLMTQVISAACANGYSKGSAQKLYNAIYSLTKVGTKEFRNQLGNLVIGDDAKFNRAVTDIIIKAILNSTSSDGDMVQAIAADIIKEIRSSKDFKFNDVFYDKARKIIPKSDPTIYNKIVNMLTVALTKSGIKTKMPGILAVLCPTHDIIKFYKIPVTDDEGKIIKDDEGNIKYKRVTIDKVEKYYKNSNIDELLDQLQEQEPVLERRSDIEMGYKYLITKTDGTQEVVHINRVHINKNDEKYKTGFRQYKGKEIPFTEISYEEFRLRNDIAKVQEWVYDGQDLRSYNVRFEDESGEHYQIGDLDIVRDYFILKDIEDIDDQIIKAFELLDKYDKGYELIRRVYLDLKSVWKEKLDPVIEVLGKSPQEILKFCKDSNLGEQFKSYLQRRLIHFMNRQMQITLDGISPNGNTNTVSINGQLVNINKSTIKTSTFGLIMPKTFKSNLGLDEFDNVEDVKNDPLFFVKKLQHKMATKVEIYEDENGNTINNYHLELKRSNGNHIYIREGLSGSDLVKKVDWIKHIDENGNVFRMTSNGIMYQMHSESDEIYQDLEGNEIIVTSGDKVTWTDMDGNEVNPVGMDLKETNGKWIDQNTGNEVKRILNSGMQFYLDTLDYNSFSISRACSDQQFKDLLSKAKNSTNKSASKLAERLSNIDGNDSQKLLKQRKIVNSMNNYSEMLKGESSEIKDFAMQHLRELGEEMHTSFLRSLEIIAARIPAQNQQSFMSMEVEAYDNPDINSAYVSVFQFYLQGSDLDIDAVSLQTFELGRDGRYVGHSPYYNLSNEETRKASDLLPFPTGQYTDIVSVNDPKKSTLGEFLAHGFLGLTHKHEKQSVFNIDVRNNGEVIVTLNNADPQTIKIFAEILENINESGFAMLIDNNGPLEAQYNLLTTAINQNFNGTGIQLTVEQVQDIEEQIIDIIDKHNQYVNKVKPQRREQIIKNYATAQLREIIDDPINRRQADSSVDVVTGPAKELSKKSPKATVQTTFTPGNVVNKFQSISENMVGKDGIAICATGLKSFFALTEMYQLILDGDNVTDKHNLLFSVNFGGKTYRGLANGFSKKFKSPLEHNLSQEEKTEIVNFFSKDVAEYLFDQLWASDASADMSALLGLSTDNAKELVLAKINAGTASIGMYLYGLSIGIPFEQLYEVMTSPLAFRLSELTKGDSFNNDSGTNNIVGALQYLRNEPTNNLKKFDTIDLTGIDVKKPSELFDKVLTKYLQGKVNDKYLATPIQAVVENKLKWSEIVVKLRKALAEEITSLKNDSKTLYEVKFNQLIEFVDQFISDASLLHNDVNKQGLYGPFNIYHDLEVLATGAEEMKQIGKILRLNQEIKTNPSDLIGQVDNIEEAILRRIGQLKKQYKRLGITKNQADPDIWEMITTKNTDKYKVNLERFMTDEAYATEMIGYYDLVKQSYNPLRILKTVPHYRGYAESLLCAFKGALDSVKFRTTVDSAKEFIKKYNVVDPKLKNQVVKNSEKAVDLFMRQSWMQSKIAPIKIAASTDKKPVQLFIDNAIEARVLNFDTEIQLGTDLGDANYKLYMETVVIPELKKRFPDNAFIKALQPVISTNTNIGAVSINYGLPINMMPRTDYERDLFNDYKEAFNELNTYGSKSSYNGMPIQNMFYYYSMIANNSKVGPTSLQGIFEDYVTTSKVAKDFQNFVSEVDSSSESQKYILKYITPEMLAPFSSPYAGGSDLIKYKNRDDDTIEIYKKQQKEVIYDDADYQGGDPAIEAYGIEAYENNNTEINGYDKVTEEAVIHNLDNRNYFQNPIIINFDGVTTITLTKDQKNQFTTLSRFGVTVKKIIDKGKSQLGLVNITTNNDKDKEIAKRFLEEIRKTENGFVYNTTIINENGIEQVVVDIEQLNKALEVIENNCI